MKTYRFLLLSLLAVFFPYTASATEYWEISPSDSGIVWQTDKSNPHSDFVEMAGQKTACVLRYGISDDHSFKIEKSLVWPTLRTVPNDTHASLMRKINADVASGVMLNERPVKESVERIRFDGILHVESRIDDGVYLTREYLPSVKEKAFVELYSIVNKGNGKVNIEIPDLHIALTTPAERGVAGEYEISGKTAGCGYCCLAPGEVRKFTFVISAKVKGDAPDDVEPEKELAARNELLDQWREALVLETPDAVLNKMFEFSKIRACESIFQTKSGPMHGPGGETYYAAVWANDQAEYANPFFPYMDYEYANASAENSFRLFSRYMNEEYKPIPSSIIAEGDSYWNGAGDRGDAAMIAYGIGRYALTRGDKNTAKELWPLMEWCLEYCHRKLNDEGVVASDADELENRFPAGDANLCTSSLYYDALLSAANLARELKIPGKVRKDYLRRAELLRKSLNRHFSGPVEGFDTYAYYKGNELLRSWICIPLTVGIYDKARSTVDALFSDKLWSDNGLLTQSGDKTYWDRSTLYALRGVIQSGNIREALPKLSSYSKTRLLGEHVPYAIEAWPEGDQRQLSAESALYARIYTEGLFGMRPVGLRSFELTPQLPDEWEKMALRNVKAFQSEFDIEVYTVSSDKIKVKVISKGKTAFEKDMKRGAKVSVTV